MLESLRQNSRSAIIYILFGVLIAAFVISFGPGGGFGGGSADRPDYAAKVNKHEISHQDFHYAYVAMGAGNMPANMAKEQRVKEFIMDHLIESELLAQQAEGLGLVASEKEAAEMVAEGKMLLMGAPRRLEGYAFKDGKFDYERFTMVAKNLYGISIARFMELQQRELMADKMRELLRSGTKVATDEVKADFEDKGRQANLEFVRFSARKFEGDLVLSDAEIETWAKGHEEQLKKLHEERKFLYQKQDPTVRLRRVLVEVAKDAPEDKVKEAQAKVDAAQKTLQAGTRFPDVARTVSEDAQSRGRGGDMGWRKQGFTGLGEEIDKKVFAAKEGEVLGPLRSDRGFELLKIEGFRKGDITLAQARAELAEELLRGERTKEKARSEAAAAAAAVKGGKKLAELFPKIAQSDEDEAKPKTGPQSQVQVEETGLFSRKGDVVQGVGSSTELVKAAFSTLKVGETVGPIQVGDSFIVATLTEKKEPDMADWEKRKAELVEEYGRTKAYETLQAWTKFRCNEAKSAGKLRVNQEAVAYEQGAQPEGNDPLAQLGLSRKYEPCADQRLF